MASDERAARVRVLVVQRDATERRRTLRFLLDAGVEAEGQEELAGARGLAAGLRFDVALVQGATATEALATTAALRAARPELGVVLACPPGALPSADAAAQAGAMLVLPLPLAPEVLVRAMEMAAEHARLLARHGELEALGDARERLTDVLGAGPAITNLARELDRIASLRTPVTLVGEPGTGHETVARSLHRRSLRAHGPFVRVGGRSLAAAGRLGELVGEVGAAHRARGLLELAHGGTLLVDEAERLPDDAQGALLRLLERGTITPVGAAEELSVDVRLVLAISNSEQIPFDFAGFRQELGLRLRTLVLELPPLRKRKDDIPLLAYRLTRAHAAALGKDVRAIGTEAMRRLRDHEWPENLRELDGVLERAVARCRSDTLVPGDLALGPELPEPSALHLPSRLLELPYAEAKARALALLDGAYVAALLAKTAGNLTRAAALAGMDRANFRRLTKRGRGSDSG
jgi:DNA-binding NtrC family response regulator